jgi:hypothetical protein
MRLWFRPGYSHKSSRMLRELSCSVRPLSEQNSRSAGPGSSYQYRATTGLAQSNFQFKPAFTTLWVSRMLM